MDLPPATPELDHDSLRETLSSCSTTVRDRGYSPPPTWDLGNRLSLYQARRSARVPSQSLRQPRLLACNENPANRFLQPKTSLFLCSSSNQRTTSALSLFSRFLSRLCFSPRATLSFPTNYLFSCFPQQYCVGLNPQLLVRSGILTDGYPAPSPH
jgi:hypothetical protein